MSEQSGDGGQHEGAGDSTQVKITVGGEDRVLSSEDVTNLVIEQGKLKEAYSPIQKILTQYGFDPSREGAEEYLRNSEAGLALANQLIEKGIIDNEGTVIEKKPSDEKPVADPARFQMPVELGASKQFETIAKALEKVAGRMDTLEEGQSNIYRRNIERDVKTDYPNLSDEDISRTLALAQADRSKGFWDHIKQVSEGKSAKEAEVKGATVKETVEVLMKAGVIPEGRIDLDKLDLSALETQEPGGLAPNFEGAKFMFKSRQRRLGKGAEGTVNPSSAMKESLDHKFK